MKKDRTTTLSRAPHLGDNVHPVSAAARIVIAVADRLADRPLIHPVTNQPVPRCMTDGILGAALSTALDTVLRKVPSYPERAAARDAVQQALPPVTGTVDEYATQLRAAAVNL
ncbi:hypothetical protein [Streptomyces griseorubiginosus]|uniref:hypothetical protein n=1 Tax=Streptomyces griseorubiginosus TaxID=67304 RepID=UPI0033270A0A